jgi:acetolactate synthase-1/2/3 large subunit
MVRQWQTLFYNKTYSNTTLDRKTDFVKLAESFGAKGYKAENLEEFKEAFAEANKAEGPVVIDLTIDKDDLVMPMMKPGGSFDRLILATEEENRHE